MNKRPKAVRLTLKADVVVKESRKTYKVVLVSKEGDVIYSDSKRK